MIKYFLLVISFFSPFVFSDVKDKMISNLDIIKNEFEVKYAPADWKMTYFGWSLDEQIDKAKERIRNTKNITLKEYQRIVRDFFASTQDYHTTVSFYTTEIAFLPFRVQGVNGRYYINRIDSTLIVDPILEGDEILMFDQRPIGDVIADLCLNELGDGKSETDQRHAELFLTSRLGTLGHYVPEGFVEIQVKSAGSDVSATYSMKWEYFPEMIQSRVQNSNSYKKYDKSKPLGEHPFFYKRRELSFYRHLTNAYKNIRKEEQNEFVSGLSIGSKRSFIPVLGEIVWKASSDLPFNAYIYELEDGTLIGYIRIPHYDGDKKTVEKFGKIIDHLNDETEALVVDQVNNPGGFPFYMYALASMLTDYPLLNLKEQVTLTQKDVMEALDDLRSIEGVETSRDARNLLGSSIQGLTVDYDLAQYILKFSLYIMEEWEKGKMMTDPYPVFGLKYIKPHPKVQYTKPILFLVNELSISCADILPALLQDNERAVIFGSKTSGAGGYVIESSYANRFGITEFSLTGSIAQRFDGTSLENLGVTPDILYRITERDLREDYVDYKEAVNQAVKGLL